MTMFATSRQLMSITSMTTRYDDYAALGALTMLARASRRFFHVDCLMPCATRLMMPALRCRRTLFR